MAYSFAESLLQNFQVQELGRGKNVNFFQVAKNIWVQSFQPLNYG
jgi:hypothetical protein